MQARYLLVRGVPGRLVANPHADPQTRRFLGKMPNGVFWDAGPTDPDTGQPRWPAAAPCDEVVLDEPSIRKAADPRRGDILILGQCEAQSIEDARTKLARPVKAGMPGEVK